MTRWIEQQRRRLAWLPLLMLAACAAAPDPQADLPHPRWPGGEEPDRIVHLREVRGSEDLRKPSALQSLGRLITGTPRQVMVQPSSAAAERDLLVVSDQERQVVHVLDFSAGRADVLRRIDREYFVSPVGVAIVGKHIAVADSALKRVALLSRKGELVRELRPPQAFERPTGLAYDPRSREIYVVDTLAHHVLVFDEAGALRRTIGGPGSDIGQFNFPTHAFVDGQGRLYVTDSLNFRVQIFDAEGRYQLEIGRHGDATGHLGVPKGVGVDSFGHIYIVDSYFSTVQIFDQQGRFLLNFGEPGSLWGQFQVPAGLALDADNRIYVCDAFNHRVQVFQYVGGAEP